MKRIYLCDNPATSLGRMLAALPVARSLVSPQPSARPALRERETSLPAASPLAPDALDRIEKGLSGLKDALWARIESMDSRMILVVDTLRKIKEAVGSPSAGHSPAAPGQIVVGHGDAGQHQEILERLDRIVRSMSLAAAGRPDDRTRRAQPEENDEKKRIPFDDVGSILDHIARGGK